jgi:hypothetical protein
VFSSVFEDRIVLAGADVQGRLGICGADESEAGCLVHVVIALRIGLVDFVIEEIGDTRRTPALSTAGGQVDPRFGGGIEHVLVLTDIDLDCFASPVDVTGFRNLNLDSMSTHS